MKPFVSTREFASVLDDHFPATEARIRDLCEAGDIPPETAKRDPAKKRGHWHIRVKTIPVFLEHTLKLNPDEVKMIMAGLERY